MAMVVDSYKDGEAEVAVLACGCRHAQTKTYDAWFPCSHDHATLEATFNDGRMAA